VTSGNPLLSLLQIAEAETQQQAVAIQTALQQDSYRELNGSVEKLVKSSNRLNLATWALVACTIVLVVMTFMLLMN